MKLSALLATTILAVTAAGTPLARSDQWTDTDDVAPPEQTKLAHSKKSEQLNARMNGKMNVAATNTADDTDKTIAAADKERRHLCIGPTYVDSHTEGVIPYYSTGVPTKRADSEGNLEKRVWLHPSLAPTKRADIWLHPSLAPTKRADSEDNLEKRVWLHPSLAPTKRADSEDDELDKRSWLHPTGIPM
ncbi:hypothetical protein KEM54_000446 [Ascosphaera aggregata]|nr:hypothetical protein KEM54_000446 [Ascosphaera aggregata]